MAVAEAGRRLKLTVHEHTWLSRQKSTELANSMNLPLGSLPYWYSH
ncbi:hypothetical protein OK016_16995 [Vibrio chagasii]|nr:hypothetical protein [Vibrio chagasii]